MTTIKELKAQMKPYKNTLVLDYFKVVRLVDVIDGLDDFYWVYDCGRKIIHSSCVCNWRPLKGKLDKKDYDRLVSVWNMNNETKAI